MIGLKNWFVVVTQAIIYLALSHPAFAFNSCYILFEGERPPHKGFPVFEKQFSARLSNEPTAAEKAEQSGPEFRPGEYSKSLQRYGHLNLEAGENFNFLSLQYNLRRGRPPQTTKILPVRHLNPGEESQRFEAIVLREFETPDFDVTIYQNSVIEGSYSDPQNLRRQLSDQEVALKVKQGIADQKKFLEENLEPVYKDYEEKRGWKAHIPAMKKKADQTRNNTNYVIVKDKAGNILTMIGFTSVAYGVVKFKDKKRGWMEMMGRFGSAYRLLKFGNRARNFNPGVPEIFAFGVPEQWNTAVDRNPAEVFFDRFLSRPVVADPRDPNDPHRGIRLESADLSQFTFPEGVDPDLSAGLYYFTGRQIEPVKLFVPKGPGSALAKLQAFAFGLEVIAIDDIGLNQNFHSNGTSIVTFNDAQGSRDKIGIYSRLGFIKDENIVPVVDEKGTVWTALVATPQSMIEAVAQLAQLSESEASKIILEIRAKYRVPILLPIAKIQ